MKKCTFPMAAVAIFLALPAVKADVVITDPTNQFSVGIGPDGELSDTGTGVGFLRLADGYDPLAAGIRDSWGVASIYSSGVSTAFADYTDFGTSNVSSTSTATSSTASYTSTTNFGVTVQQNYSFAAPNVLEIAATITNMGPTANVFFQRDVNWNVFPTESNENSFGGIPFATPLADTSYSGLENPDPGAGAFVFSCLGCNQIGDLGGGIKVFFPSLLSGQSANFVFFYGISQSGESANALDAQLAAAGSIYTITTQSSENGAYPNLGTNSAAIGFGLTAVPEPSSVALFVTMLTGFGGIAWRRRRRKV
jgi:hypothetical protein